MDLRFYFYLGSLPRQQTDGNWNISHAFTPEEIFLLRVLLAEEPKVHSYDQTASQQSREDRVVRPVERQLLHF